MKDVKSENNDYEPSNLERIWNQLVTIVLALGIIGGSVFLWVWIGYKIGKVIWG